MLYVYLLAYELFRCMSLRMYLHSAYCQLYDPILKWSVVIHLVKNEQGLCVISSHYRTVCSRVAPLQSSIQHGWLQISISQASSLLAYLPVPASIFLFSLVIVSDVKPTLLFRISHSLLAPPNQPSQTWLLLLMIAEQPPVQPPSNQLIIRLLMSTMFWTNANMRTITHYIPLLFMVPAPTTNQQLAPNSEGNS